MDIKIFSDIVEALEQVGTGLVALKDIPTKERQHYREIIGETYELLDTAVTLVLNRLGDLLQIEKQEDFIRELRGLDSFKEWIQIERDVRLCSNLRTTGSEMKSLWNNFMDRISLRNPEDFERLVYWILEQGEAQLANFITESLSRLALLNVEAAKSPKGYANAMDAVREARNALRKERKRLISSEIEFSKSI